MQRTIAPVLMLTTVVLGNAAPSFAQTAAAELQATARLDRREIQQGQAAMVILEVRGAQGRPEIDIPTSDDCSISLAGRLKSSPALAGLPRAGLGTTASGLQDSLQKMMKQLENEPLLQPDALKNLNDPDAQKKLQSAMGNLGIGKPDEPAMAYHVHANRTGTIVIPSFSVKANGQTVTTKPLELHVSPAKNQDHVRLAMSLSNPRPMVGQEVQLLVDVLVRRGTVTYQNQTFPHLPLKGIQVSLPSLEIGPLELARPLEDILKEHAPAQGHHGYHVNHLPSEAVFEDRKSVV